MLELHSCWLVTISSDATGTYLNPSSNYCTILLLGGSNGSYDKPLSETIIGIYSFSEGISLLKDSTPVPMMVLSSFKWESKLDSMSLL
jgi:hypothetical protein